MIRTSKVVRLKIPCQKTSSEWTKPIWYRMAPSTEPTATAPDRGTLKLIRMMITAKMITSLMMSISRSSLSQN